MTTDPDRPVATPAATGIGSLPGDDMAGSLRLVFDLLAERPGMPFLPELPGRGVGADVTGRGAALLADLYAEVQPSGWRIVDRPGRDHRRAVGYLSADLDLLEEHAQGYTGPLKVQAVGPWTLAATVELPHGDKLLGDPGAVRDVTASLAEGLRRHVDAVRRRVPGAEIVLQLDEPALPGVLRGTVPTASGFGRLRAVEQPVAREALRQVVQAVEVPVVMHCCAPDVPFDTFREAGAVGLSFDLGLVPDKNDDVLGVAVETGVTLFAGVVPTLDPASPVSYKMLLERLLQLRRLGFAVSRLAESLVVTPTCGLAGASPRWAAQALKLGVDAARALEEVD